MNHKFWSDDFDMDLLKIFPNIEESLGATAHEVIWTVGHTSFSRLNHPIVWNTHGAFLWLEKPNLTRDEYGWTSIHGCVTNKAVVECTWIEWLRDYWAHNYGFLIQPTGEYFPAAPYRHFSEIMNHIRSWTSAELANDAHAVSWSWMHAINYQFAKIVERHRLSKGELIPYYAKGSIPGMGCQRPNRPLLPERGSSERVA